ncbi:MAG: CapA family protein [Salinirussus sp.]
MSPTIGFTGDVMLGRNVDRRYRGRPPEEIWGTALDPLQHLDGLLINLECCLSTRGEQWTRTRRPFHFRANPDWAIPALKTAGVDWCSLANNHLLDYETTALLDTIDVLEEAGISNAGAGADEVAALSPSILSANGVRIGVCAFTDNTPEYAAGVDEPGVARLDMNLADDEKETVRGVLGDIHEADVDVVVASLHWGPNNVTVPDDQYRRFGRWLLEEGVDIVHGHSAHVFQGIEPREDGLILYDCGDFVDDYRVDPDLRNDRSFLFELNVAENGELENLVLRPTEIRDMRVHLETDTIAWWADRLRERCRPFGTAGDVERSDEYLVVNL